MPSEIISPTITIPVTSFLSEKSETLKQTEDATKKDIVISNPQITVDKTDNADTQMKIWTTISYLPDDIQNSDIHAFTKEDKQVIAQFAQELTTTSLKIKRLTNQLKQIDTLLQELKQTSMTPERTERLIQKTKDHVLQVLNTTSTNSKQLEEIVKIWETRFMENSQKIADLTTEMKKIQSEKGLMENQKILEDVQLHETKLKNLETNLGFLLNAKKEMSTQIEKLQTIIISHDSLLKITQQKTEELKQAEKNITQLSTKLENFPKQIEGILQSITAQVNEKLALLEKRVTTTETKLDHQQQNIQTLNKNIEEILKIIKTKLTKEKVGAELEDLIEKNKKEISQLTTVSKSSVTIYSEIDYQKREKVLNTDLAKKADLAELLNVIQKLDEENPELLKLLVKAEALIQEIMKFKPQTELDKEILKGKNSQKKDIYDDYMKENKRIFDRITEISKKYFEEV